MDWYLKVLKDYVTFTGRARRKEFWMFTLFHLIFISLLAFLLVYSTEGFFTDEYSESGSDSNVFVTIILMLYMLGTFLPSLAVTVRRLHDTGKSGWWYFISIIPYIGSFILLIFLCMESETRPNKWGQNPKGIGNDRMINQIGTE